MTKMEFKGIRHVVFLVLSLVIVLVMVGCSIGESQSSNGGLLINQVQKDTATAVAGQMVKGTDNDGYFWFIWKEDSSGTATITHNVTTANYQSSWNGIKNFTCGKGWPTGNTTRVIKYSGSFDGGTNGYLAVYGWMENPLVEYYILETWGSWDPNTDGNLTNTGKTVDSDGGTYKIYSATRPVGSGNITGDTNQTFKQYWSIRSTKKTAPLSGTVTVSNHFKAWQNAGFTLGTFASRDYQVVETEGYKSNGSSNITIGEGTTTPTTKAWSALGSGTNDYVNALVSNGSTVYVGGNFTTAGGYSANRVAQLSGTSWGSSLNSTIDNYVNCLTVNPSTGALFVGGMFSTPSTYLARYLKTTGWSSAYSTAFDGQVYALAYGSSSGNSRIYAGGDFTHANSTAVTSLAQWNGTAWTTIGNFPGTLQSGGFGVRVNALTCDSSGALYVSWQYYIPSGHGAQTIHTVSKWNGSTWTALGSTNDFVGALAVSGSTLYAGGGFTSVGSTSANAIAKYSGSSWSALGTGLSWGWVRALVCDSSGNLYVGGAFGQAGSVTANNIAMYSSSGSWSALGSGTNSEVSSLAIDSTGALYVGGGFTSPGNYIAVYK